MGAELVVDVAEIVSDQVNADLYNILATGADVPFGEIIKCLAKKEAELAKPPERRKQDPDGEDIGLQEMCENLAAAAKNVLLEARVEIAALLANMDTVEAELDEGYTFKNEK